MAPVGQTRKVLRRRAFSKSASPSGRLTHGAINSHRWGWAPFRHAKAQLRVSCVALVGGVSVRQTSALAKTEKTWPTHNLPHQTRSQANGSFSRPFRQHRSWARMVRSMTSAKMKGPRWRKHLDPPSSCGGRHREHPHVCRGGFCSLGHRAPLTDFGEAAHEFCASSGSQIPDRRGRAECSVGRWLLALYFLGAGVGEFFWRSEIVVGGLAHGYFPAVAYG